MLVFLFIGSGDVQPWAKKHSNELKASEQAPLSGLIKSLENYLESNSICFYFRND